MTFFLPKLMTFPEVLSYANNQEQLTFSFPYGWFSLFFTLESYTMESAYIPPLTLHWSVTTPLKKPRLNVHLLDG